ncbi:MAG: YjgP/YjgQ family permease [Bacteroidales bacterium]|nr:YjgP/YjgQ family permease [Bacteroidales bacterium]
MRIIKRLNLFILKSFLPLFAMTFFIVLFIVLMQFLWKYIDDLVGKGLSMGVLGELFFYAAVSMVPMALPLAILLASLMTFGNFGEKFELTAMKASGISLLKVMRPLIIFIGFIAVGAFFFQNDVLPKAQVKMWTLLFSMRQKSPELEIPEGTFYDQIPGYNLFVKHKDKETGMLYDMMIYDISRGGDNATILLSDSARLAFTPDMRYLYLHLFTGEQFENLRDQSNLDRNVPFRRETFKDKEVLIKFDANFNRLDEDGMRRQYVGKNIAELRATIDSVGRRVDSIGRNYAAELRHTSFPALRGDQSGSGDTQSKSGISEVSGKKDKPSAVKEVNIDSLITSLDAQRQAAVFDAAKNLSRRRSGELQFRADDMAAEKKTIRRHEIELLKKYTLSVACLVFFFIGAPLGAIIRKGGLGTPLVISVLLFLVYYIFDNTGYKMARDGHWPVWFGMWLSSFILIPLGCYVTIKAMNDSSVFDRDRYVNFFNRLLGRRQARSVRAKEVIINDISVDEAIKRLGGLKEDVVAFLTRYSRRQSYFDYWIKGYDMNDIRRIGVTTDDEVEYLTDCRDPFVVNKLTEFPVIAPLWVYAPSKHKWLSYLMIVIFPIGIPVWLFGLDAQSKLKGDMRRVVAACDVETELLQKMQS